MARRWLTLAGLTALALMLLLVPDSLAKKPTKPPPEPANPAIAYVADWNSGHLWVMDLDGSNATEVFDAHCGEPGFSPDGTRLFTHVLEEDGVGFYVMDVDGANANRLFTRINPGAPWNASWSTTGWIAFTDLDGHPDNDIFVIRPNGSGLTNLTNGSVDAEFDPS
ncbi:MAG: TolB family protein, partial [Planctomycetota bacterium]